MKKHIVIKSASCLDMINAINSKIRELDPSAVMSSKNPDNCNSCNTCGCQDNVQGSNDCSDCNQNYIQGSDSVIDDNYIDEIMQSVADETVSLEVPAVCSWRIEGRKIVFVLTGIDEDFVDEYTCPIMDLTGDIGVDIDYILSAINER